MPDAVVHVLEVVEVEDDQGEASSVAVGPCDFVREGLVEGLAVRETGEAVLDRELALAKNPGRDAVTRALALAPNGDAVVRLNPADVKTLGSVSFGRELSVVADPSVEPAGAVVEVGACRIDAQIGTALERVRDALS